MRHRRDAAFTLIEVMIVVVIMAILAATIIPQMSNSTTDAKEALLRDHLRSVRMAIEMYKVHHKGKVPAVLVAQITAATDDAGNTSESGLPEPGFPHGPYLKKMPAQPFSNVMTVRNVSASPTAVAAPGSGWMYHAASGRFWVDHLTYVAW